MVRYVSGDSLGADEPLARGLTLSGGYPEACRLLGLAPDEEATRQGTERMTAEEARMLLRRALKQVPLPGKSATPGESGTPALKRTRRPWASRVGGARSADVAALGELLYWRDR
jgi:hypothetical protein